MAYISIYRMSVRFMPFLNRTLSLAPQRLGLRRDLKLGSKMSADVFVASVVGRGDLTFQLRRVQRPAVHSCL